jgi:quinol monooxygenase YgiN
MKDQGITVFYKWTAKPGKFDELKAIYQQVRKEMEENEPGTLMMQCYYDEEQSALIVNDLFKDGAALGAHLGVTAAGHFPKLAEIAVPGPFFFCGDVPEELKQAAIGMNMGAEFSTHAFGFERSQT